MNENLIKEKLFQDGLKKYKAMDYFEAHESWEDLWSDFYNEDRKFIQGLIQLAVSFVHIGNGNIIGAKSLINKSEIKFKDFSGVHRGINVKTLIKQIKKVQSTYDELTNIDDFDWDVVPTLE